MSGKNIASIFIGAGLLLPNLYIVPTVLYHQSKGECVMYVARGSSLESCGLLSNPIMNILIMNIAFWAICILVMVVNTIYRKVHAITKKIDRKIF